MSARYERPVRGALAQAPSPGSSAILCADHDQIGARTPRSALSMDECAFSLVLAVSPLGCGTHWLFRPLLVARSPMHPSLPHEAHVPQLPLRGLLPSGPCICLRASP